MGWSGVRCFSACVCVCVRACGGGGVAGGGGGVCVCVYVRVCVRVLMPEFGGIEIGGCRGLDQSVGWPGDHGSQPLGLGLALRLTLVRYIDR